MTTDPTGLPSHGNMAAAAASGAFQTLSVVQATSSLEELLRKVTHDCGRVQIVGQDEGRNGVLISQTELESLEEALAILSATQGAEIMRHQVIAAAASTMFAVSHADPAVPQR